MDSFTQIVLGAAVGEAVLGKKIGNRAPLYGALAGTIPDLDVLFTGFMDYSSVLLFHRGKSHSVLFALLMAIFLSQLLTRFEKYKPPKDWFWLFFLVFITHALLDAQTTWGVQLFWPLKARFAVDNVFIIDPFYTLPFALLLVLAIFRERNDPLRKRLNHAGLIISSSYLLLSLAFKGIAFQKFESALTNQKIEFRNVNTRPSPMNIVLWSANIETEDSYLMGHYSLFDSKPIEFDTYQKDNSLSAKWKFEESLQKMIQFSEGWYLITEEENHFYFNDLRSGTYSFNEGAYDFVFKYKMVEDETGRLSFSRENTTPKDLSRLAKQLWNRIKGN
ncbi:MAG: metal-dependent hydrolase [Cyclobacteriaceae bacterium]